ncbi:matrix metalloproteinase-21 [Lingula anatina]|uniref:Matrix metalloproteinase-21 n=1 Tax=Lingula anatina TaxID=7574 RepID=A0A1S3J2Q3_LINAN|nr:matrix metalloproteinase-21 [Lingula anatina]XP_013404682.1 matrix metalloproteinase-21 [Lingula anatina]XP_013404683.1 matrix metalloproteinase-21 [Lingula anatina]XP_013404684.1 matrix metalloproteinase-21 [Lingula anatina]XP_013404685.1 matrix metalloproteinase-21 [Lingula anatina]|eukprot:XP_013404681.1 matrix metalloproteinase-21 [Lingula anatina]
MTMNYSQLGHIFVFLLVLEAVWAEMMHMQRDFRDASKFNIYRKYQNQVTASIEAMGEEYLYKFDYMNCTTPSLRRKRREIPRFARSMVLPYKIRPFKSKVQEVIDAGSESDCSLEQKRKAISKLQSTFGLNVTGELDEKTLALMRKPRCGNSDKDIIKNVTALIDDTEEELSDTNTTATSLFNSATNGSSNNTSGTTPAPSEDGTTVASSSRQSILLSTIAPSSSEPDNSYTLRHRRKRQVDEIMQRLQGETQRELEKRAKIVHMVRRRRRRSAVMTQQRQPIGHLQGNDRVVTWRLTGSSSHIDVIWLRALISMAFRMWSEVSPLKFQELPVGHVQDLDISISFGRSVHNCPFVFDGPGGEVAHSRLFSINVEIHMDDDENYVNLPAGPTSGNEVNTMVVLLHEIGHSLGIQHIAHPFAVMVPLYDVAGATVELSEADRNVVLRMYGPCTSKMSTAFDWVRVRPDGTVFYNTYFFSAGSAYWMYLNSENRPRYGDPLEIQVEWQGVPDNLDTYLHLWYQKTDTYPSTMVNEQLFIKGDTVYVYDPAADKVKNTTTIQSRFGHAIPNNLDAACFENRGRSTVYFFKGKMVYTYNVHTGEVTTKSFTEQFPTMSNSEQLTGNIDACYYSYNTKHLYFIKDDKVWQNECFDVNQTQITNCLRYINKRSHRWRYLCEV